MRILKVHHEPEFWEYEISVFGVTFIYSYAFVHWRNRLNVLCRAPYPDSL